MFREVIKVPRMAKKINHAYIVVQLLFHVIIQTQEMQVFPIAPHQAYMALSRQDTNKCSTLWYDANIFHFFKSMRAYFSSPFISYPKIIAFMTPHLI